MVAISGHPADKLNCVEPTFAGAQMGDRIVGALETACRLGEMLKIQNRHVLWETHQIVIPAEHAKECGIAAHSV